jgi:SAM-dependent methyltransferase
LILSAGEEVACAAKLRGRAWICVAMPEEVRRLWDARPAEELQALVRRTRRRQFYTPIYHPALRHARVDRPEPVRLDRLSRVLGSLGEGLSGLDVGCNVGYWCHHLARRGFGMTGLDLDADHLAVAVALNPMYRLDVRFVSSRFQDFEPDHAFDVTVALSVLYHLFFRQGLAHPEKAAAKVGRLTRHALFWESGDEPGREIELILAHTGLTEYYPLGPTAGTGKQREMGLFLRPGTPLARLLAERWQHEFGEEERRRPMAVRDRLG